MDKPSSQQKLPAGKYSRHGTPDPWARALIYWGGPHSTVIDHLVPRPNHEERRFNPPAHRRCRPTEPHATGQVIPHRWATPAPHTVESHALDLAKHYLSTGPIHSLRDPLDPAIPKVAAGCYTILDGTGRFMYAGMAGRGPMARQLR